MREQWKPIPGLPGYEASNQGRVRSWLGRGGTRRDTPRVLKPSVNTYRGGYKSIGFTVRGVVRRLYVHRVVLKAFGYPGRKGQEVRHLDGDRGNNRLRNLKWGCHRVNMKDQVHHGTHTKGHQNGNAKLTPRQVEVIRASKLTSTALAQRYGVHLSTVCRARKGQRYA